MTGRDMNDKSTPPADSFRNMFPATVIRDASMAHKVSTLANKVQNENDSFLILCGLSHMAYGIGVPERIWNRNPELKAQTCTMV